MDSLDPIIVFFTQTLSTGLFSFLLALAILFFGYILARIIASVVRRLLKRTQLDNRLASTLSGPDEKHRFEVEDVIAKVVFWILMIFVLVAFFETLGIPGIAAPLSAFLNDVTTQYLPNMIGAGLLLLIAWLVATALKFLVLKVASITKLDERLTRYTNLEEGEQVAFSASLATAVFWLIFLLFLPAVLSALGIEQIAQPLQGVFDQILSFVPNILGAVIVVLIGWFVARLILQISTNLLKALGADKAGERVGLSDKYSLSTLIGNLLYIFVILVTIITALDTLAIEAISGPTKAMLTTIVNAIPGVLGAALVLIVSFAIARLIAKLAEEFLAGIGFNQLPAKLGLSWSGENTPSKVIGYLILVAIMLLAATSAAELLGSAFLVTALALFIAFFWQVILAVVIFAIGLYFANLAKNLIAGTGTNQAMLIARLAQVVIIIFTSAMSLRQLGLANDIINMAFGITLAAIGVAVALAVGLGSKEIAGREVDRLISKVREEDKLP